MQSNNQSVDIKRASPRWRRIKDNLARYFIAAGGVGVIIAVLMIFVYLLHVVAPLFGSASVDAPVSIVQTVDNNDANDPVVLSVDEGLTTVLSIDIDGHYRLLDRTTGEIKHSDTLPLDGANISASFKLPGGPIALATDAGTVLMIEVGYEPHFNDGVRTIHAEVEFPLGPDAVVLSDQRIDSLAVAPGDSAWTMASISGGAVQTLRIGLRENLMTGELRKDFERGQVTGTGAVPHYIAISGNQRYLYVGYDSRILASHNLSQVTSPPVLERFDTAAPMTSMRMLLGGISLLIGDQRGVVTQYSPVRDDTGHTALAQLRTLEVFDGEPVTAIIPEARRKGFIALSDAGHFAMVHTTANNVVLDERIGDARPTVASLSPRSNGWVYLDAAGELELLPINNRHPEVSWHSLWEKVWYENYQEPEYVWQSSAANHDFEPKFSLTPLAFGTLKAAFYALLFAIPIGLLGAIYTAYFMAPKLRQTVKPTIEIMEALPTVILGFLAGLWLAPYIENHLAAVLGMLLLMPFGMLGFAWLSHRFKSTVGEVTDGWQPLLLAPVVVVVAWLSLHVGSLAEYLLFDGNIRGWLNEIGVTYDQRNAMIVGIAMGFGVVPTIFSIAEDAIFGVPRSLTQGSLSLGATRWQTMVRVVLPTASPGIFSALMIGLGRAVGETMIVLMATGNTPIMDFNIFEGMRTLSANIAVEMPESEVGGTHYRVLFLAALVLFLFTFVVNTIAEQVRHRLRQKYGSL